MNEGERATATRLVGRTVTNVRLILCDRPFGRDILLELDDGTRMSICSNEAEDPWLDEGEHGL